MAFIVKVGNKELGPKPWTQRVAGALDITIGDEDKNSTRWEYKH